MRLNIRVTDIAASLGIKHPSVSVVISGKQRNPRVRAAIAKAIDKPVHEIWPENKKKRR